MIDNPKVAWQNLLAKASNKIFFMDFDGTIWEDILVKLNEEFGPIDPKTGLKKWHQYDHAFKVAKTMTNGAHLQAEYDDIFAAKSFGEVVAYLESQHKLIDGFKDFLNLLESLNVTPIGITNGASQIAQTMLKHHGIDMIFVGNSLNQFPNRELPELSFFHNENDGIDKGRLLQEAHDLGYRVLGFAGDSRGDVTGAQVCANLGGLVLASGHNNGLAEFCKLNLTENQYVVYETFDSELLSVLKSRFSVD